MKIAQDVRDHAKGLNGPARRAVAGADPHPEEAAEALAQAAVSKDEIERGRAQMSEKFRGDGRAGLCGGGEGEGGEQDAKDNPTPSNLHKTAS